LPKPPSLTQVGRIDVFVSSSSEPEALHLRNELDQIVMRLNVSLREAQVPLVLDLFHWWQPPPQRVRRRRVNRTFVDRALASHAVFALLVRLIRPGTKDEIKEVYNKSSIPLSIFYCPPQGDPSTASWRLRLLFRWMSNRVIYKSCGDPYGTEAHNSLYDALLQIALKHRGVPSTLMPYESR
jgi:hypothetical protein